MRKGERSTASRGGGGAGGGGRMVKGCVRLAGGDWGKIFYRGEFFSAHL